MNSHGDRLRLAPPPLRNAIWESCREPSGLPRKRKVLTKDSSGNIRSPRSRDTCSFQKNVGRATVTNNEKGKLVHTRFTLVFIDEGDEILVLSKSSRMKLK